MKTVTEIYAEYKIMPFLQMHQLRVAAVGRMIAQNSNSKLDERSIVIACLFHDMGNILKSDFTLFPEACEPEGLMYWEHEKADFLKRYGPDVHHATSAIGHELHLPLQAMKYMEQIGFSRLEYIRDHPSYELKIVEYADCRVAPHGVVPMLERLEEGRIRYAKVRPDREGNKEVFDTLVSAASEIERQISAQMRIKPDDITEAALQSSIAELKNFQLT